MAEDLRKQVKRLEVNLIAVSTKELPRAMNSALNKVATKVKSSVAKKVGKENKIKQKLIREKISVKRSTPKTRSATIGMNPSGIAAVKQLTPAQIQRNMGRGTNKKGVRVAGRQLNHAFINIGKKTGKPHVLWRKGKERYPIRTVSLKIHRTAQKRFFSEAERIHKKDFKRLYTHELNFRINKYAK